ncbi:MAG: class I SAM-dependent methyltransferase [Alphaproteobacteria bacterium TMED89]|nr:hypothetical protein [Rhodospirillaceae bacterium]RPH15952.1 MAG: class I SAM-dependent methyltransferase [Alphaproteobacteria bacterium TMED89]
MPEQAQNGLDVKDMKLYAQANSILADLAALGFPGDAALSVEDLARFDQLHYHGVESVQAGIDLLGINAAAEVLEVGAGWGGPSRFIASRTGARVVALELQEDFHTTGQTLTQRCGLDIFVNHQRGDFLSIEYGQAAFDHVVSWLALYHIPNRATYTRKICDLLKPGGTLFVEDLMAGTAFADTDADVLGRELFANSMVSEAHYIDSLRVAGFEIIQAENMTADWRTFTTTRLEMFDANRQAFIGIHGPELFEARRHFYSKIVEYFTADAIGGMRVAARKP